MSEVDIPTREAVAETELSSAIRAILSTQHGKRFVYWVLERCNVYADAYSGEFSNETHVRLGEQRVGRAVIARLDEVDPKLYPSLLLDIATIREIDEAQAKSLADRMEPEDE